MGAFGSKEEDSPDADVAVLSGARGPLPPPSNALQSNRRGVTFAQDRGVSLGAHDEFDNGYGYGDGDGDGDDPFDGLGGGAPRRGRLRSRRDPVPAMRISDPRDGAGGVGGGAGAGARAGVAPAIVGEYSFCEWSSRDLWTKCDVRLEKGGRFEIRDVESLAAEDGSPVFSSAADTLGGPPSRDQEDREVLGHGGGGSGGSIDVIRTTVRGRFKDAGRGGMVSDHSTTTAAEASNSRFSGFLTGRDGAEGDTKGRPGAAGGTAGGPVPLVYFSSRKTGDRGDAHSSSVPPHQSSPHHDHDDDAAHSMMMTTTVRDPAASGAAAPRVHPSFAPHAIRFVAEQVVVRRRALAYGDTEEEESVLFVAGDPPESTGALERLARSEGVDAVVHVPERSLRFTGTVREATASDALGDDVPFLSDAPPAVVELLGVPSLTGEIFSDLGGAGGAAGGSVARLFPAFDRVVPHASAVDAGVRERAAAGKQDSLADYLVKTL